MGSCLLQWMLLASGLISLGMSARILGVFPFPSRSHVIIYSTLLKELAARGHQVTAVSAYPLETPMANYTDIKLHLDMSSLMSARENKSMFSLGDTPALFLVVLSHLIGPAFAEQAFQQKEVQELISSTDEKFDLVVLPDFFCEAVAGFAHKFDAPIIYMSPITGFPWTNDLVGNPSNDAYISSIFTARTDHMTFWERLENSFLNTFGRIFHQLYHMPSQDRMMRKYFHGIDDLPHLSEINQRTALVFTYAMPGVNYPQPLLPNVVQIGGIHLKPAKPLPTDLKKYMDAATEGVIYFSMGSNLRSAEFPEEMRAAFIKTFSKLKQKVLWKFEDENLPGQPDNLKISKWFPQNDILAHQNIVLFITHGGILSTQEVVHHGVPVVGIPIFGDQSANVKLLEHLSCGLQLKFSEINEANVEKVVTEVLTNPRYREGAKKVSRIFRDQPHSPLQKAVFWTEYVLRHKGARHLRSAVLDLSWYQYLLLDVVAALIIVPAGVAWCVLLICRKLLCAKRKTPDAQVSKKKKQ